MKFVKWLALSLLGLLLFLSLSVLGLVFALNSTILSPGFVIQEMDKLDMYSLAGEWAKQQISQLEVPTPYEPYVAKVANDTLDDLKPWAKEQVNTIVRTGYDYFLGRSQHLSLLISLEPVRDRLRQSLKEAIFASPPPELQGLPPGMIKPVLDEVNRQIDQQIPASLTFSLDTSSRETVSQFEQVRLSIGYLQLGSKVLSGFILLLILGIVVIDHAVRGTSQRLGIIFLTSGVFSYLGNLAIKYFIGAQLAQLPLHAQFQTLPSQLLADFLAPLDIYSIVLAILGTALLIVSFVYKPR